MKLNDLYYLDKYKQPDIKGAESVVKKDIQKQQNEDQKTKIRKPVQQSSSSITDYQIENDWSIYMSKGIELYMIPKPTTKTKYLR